jgi:hypothetical protein
VRWAESDAALAIDAVLVLADNLVGFSVVTVRLVCALVYADFAADAPLLVPLNQVLWNYVCFHLLCLHTC